jgi:hypothetical protein
VSKIGSTLSAKARAWPADRSDAAATRAWHASTQSSSSGVISAIAISRRSIGTGVKVSNALSGFSAPATSGVSTTSTRFSMRMPKQDHAALEGPMTKLRDPRRTLMH